MPPAGAAGSCATIAEATTNENAPAVTNLRMALEAPFLMPHLLPAQLAPGARAQNDWPIATYQAFTPASPTAYCNRTVIRFSVAAIQ